MQPKCINLVCIVKCMVYDAAKKIQCRRQEFVTILWWIVYCLKAKYNKSDCFTVFIFSLIWCLITCLMNIFGLCCYASKAKTRHKSRYLLFSTLELTWLFLPLELSIMLSKMTGPASVCKPCLRSLKLVRKQKLAFYGKRHPLSGTKRSLFWTQKPTNQPRMCMYYSVGRLFFHKKDPFSKVTTYISILNGLNQLLVKKRD